MSSLLSHPGFSFSNGLHLRLEPIELVSNTGREYALTSQALADERSTEPVRSSEPRLRAAPDLLAFGKCEPIYPFPSFWQRPHHDPETEPRINDGAAVCDPDMPPRS